MAAHAGQGLWGWNVRARRLVSGLCVVLALSLGWAARPSLAPARLFTTTTLVIDPNTAPPAVLAALPRLGPVLVGRMVKERERRPFASLADLDERVRGVGPATVAAIRPYLRFGAGPPPASLAFRAREAAGAP